MNNGLPTDYTFCCQEDLCNRYSIMLCIYIHNSEMLWGGKSVAVPLSLALCDPYTLMKWYSATQPPIPIVLWCTCIVYNIRTCSVIPPDVRYMRICQPRLSTSCYRNISVLMHSRHLPPPPLPCLYPLPPPPPHSVSAHSDLHTSLPMHAADTGSLPVSTCIIIAT